MQRYAVGIEFSGVQYRGWQTQQQALPAFRKRLNVYSAKLRMNLLHFMVRVEQMQVYMQPIWWHISIRMPFDQKRDG